jgi:hypothetical protein
VRKKGGLPGPSPVVPHPESLAAQAAYPFGHSASHGHAQCQPECLRLSSVTVCVSLFYVNYTGSIGTAVPIVKLFAWGEGAGG